jgi:starvation-inducible DNA-binding protein
MNRIGLDQEQSEMLSDKLNELLANYQIFYMNTRSYHWNIKGEKFFELHAKFEELYLDALEKIDEIAERVLTLGHTPLHTFEDYGHTSHIVVAKNVTNGKAAVQGILDAYEVLLSLERTLLQLSGDADDEGTNALMSDYIREQEKLVWMFSAFMH